MKKLICKTTLTVAVLLLSTVWLGNVFANNIFRKSEFTKEINKEFSISANGDVKIYNKYGNVNITTGNDSKVKFDIKIVVKADNKSTADEAFNRIKVEFENSSNLVQAETNFENKEKRDWSFWKKLTYTINYEVSLPNTVDLNVHNKYGNVYIDDMKGNVDLDVKYGNLNAGNIDKDVNLQLGYGNANLGDLGNATVEIKYSKLDIETMKDLRIESKYSHIYIDEAGAVKSETKYDKYHLGDIASLRNYGKYDDFEIKSVKKVDAVGKFSDYDISMLDGSADFEMQYGDANIRKVGDNFGDVNLTGKHTDLIIDLSGHSAKFNLKGNHTKIKVPSASKKETDDREGDWVEVVGSIGSGGSAINVNTEHGTIVIYQ